MAEPPAILVVRLSALGDVIHTMPAAVALRRARPQARIAWVVEASLRELVAAVAPVDRVIGVDTHRWRRAPLAVSTVAAIRRVANELRSHAKGGVAIDFQGLVKSGLFTWLSGSRERWGFGARAIRERLALAFVNRTVDVDPTLHVVEQNLELAAAFTEEARAPAVMPDFGGWADRADPSLDELARDRIVIIPAAGRPSKQWPEARFAALCREIEQRFAERPLVVWGPGEREIASRVAESGHAALAPATDLAGLTAVVRAARLVVAGDTGPLHLADAVGTRVVGLYGATRPWRNGPWRQPGACVHAESMDAIGIEEVADRIGAMLV